MIEPLLGGVLSLALRHPIHHHQNPKPRAVPLSVTAYCWTGSRAANGQSHMGTAAGNRWPLGTRLHVASVGDVTITDRIGWGSDLDLYFGRSGCEQRAVQFGRRTLKVRVR